MDIEKKIKQQEQWTVQFTLTKEQQKLLFQNKLDRMKQYWPYQQEKVREIA